MYIHGSTRYTSRCRQKSCFEYAEEIPVFAETLGAMSFAITSVGTALHRRLDNRGELVQDTTWPVVGDWGREKIQAALRGREELREQAEAAQSRYKLSYLVQGVSDKEHGRYVASLEEVLGRSGLSAQILFSGGEYLDLLPVGVNKGTAFDHLADTPSIDGEPAPLKIAAEDSMNGAAFLQAADIAIVPGNAQPSLVAWAQVHIPAEKLYLAKRPFAAGILEGLEATGVVR